MPHPLQRAALLALFLLLMTAPVRAAEFLLFYSNDVRGETEPCGCSAKQRGGMSRKAAQISQIAAAEQLPFLYLDSGGLLFKETRLPAGQEEQAKIAAQGLAAAMQVMRCQAAGVGAHDLAGGVELLRQFQDTGQLTWLSMNLVDRQQNQPVFTPWLLTKTAGLSVAVLGLTNEKTRLAPADQEHYALLPWEQTLPKALAQVRDKADMIILLSSCPETVNKKIAKAHPEINLLLHSGPGAATAYPVMVNQTVFAQTGPRGKSLGLLRIVWTAAGKWDQQDLSAIRMEQSRLDRIILQMSRFREKHENWDLSRDKDWQLLLADKQAAKNRINTMLRQQKPPDKSLSRFTARFIPLESELPEDPAVLAIMDRTAQRINAFSKAEKADQPTTAADALRSLAGWQSCADCHAAQAAFWQQTGHARSMAALEAKKQQFNPDCVVCHVTLPDPAGAAEIKENKLLLRLPEQFRRVSCESCHGPAAAHDADPTETPVPHRQPGEQVCKTCHQPEHDSHFVFAEKEKRIRCPDSAVELPPETR
ncbi:Cytochrome c554 and c-prime [Candidatus Electronema halotolerans]